MSTKQILVTLLILFYAFNLSAQEDIADYETKARINKQYIKSYFLDTRDILISPVHWKAKEWIIAGATVGGVALMTTQDLKIRNYAQENRNAKTDFAATHIFEPCGSGVYSMPIMATYYLHGLIFKNERSKKTAMLGVKAYIFAGTLVNIPKLLLNRQRPFQGSEPDPNMWMGPFYGTFLKSMPSGHTTAAFAVATIVASEYRETIYVPIIAYSIATLTGISRINDDKHWASDVLAGAVFGWAMSKLIYNHNNWKVNIVATTDGKSVSMGLCMPLDGIGKKRFFR